MRVGTWYVLKAMWPIWALIAGVLCLYGAALFATWWISLDTSPPVTTSSDEVACDLFWPASGDYAQGLMRETELREAIKAVHENARWAADQNLRLNATDMLTALTIWDLERYAVAARGTGVACMALGHY